MLEDTVNKRVVCILLECNLVLFTFFPLSLDVNGPLHNTVVTLWFLKPRFLWKMHPTCFTGKGSVGKSQANPSELIKTFANQMVKCVQKLHYQRAWKDVRTIKSLHVRVLNLWAWTIQYICLTNSDAKLNFLKMNGLIKIKLAKSQSNLQRGILGKDCGGTFHQYQANVFT